MRGAHKAKEMKRRASQRRAAHKARLAALARNGERGGQQSKPEGARRRLAPKALQSRPAEPASARRVAPSVSQIAYSPVFGPKSTSVQPLRARKLSKS
jgi:hypothetical protein